MARLAAGAIESHMGALNLRQLSFHMASNLADAFINMKRIALSALHFLGLIIHLSTQCIHWVSYSTE